MGKITDSIISGTSGRTGRIVVANVNGYEISRIRPKKSSKPSSPKQMLVKDRFNKSVLFVSSYRDFAKQFFGNKVGLKSPYNLAIGSVMKAFECDMENLVIVPNYHEIHFAKGRGVDPYPTGISSPAAFTLQIDWENNAQGAPSETDQLVVLLAEDQQLAGGSLFLITNTTRQELTHQLTLLPRYENKEMHVWIAFLSQNEDYVSNSTYIGTVLIS